ncbi:hypothetical protein FQN54_007811 [Arachnomyces sp. PD_36]|nr:hypothetical protein FQN54_007811 [Arachnomyces sp. PD_36]
MPHATENPPPVDEDSDFNNLLAQLNAPGGQTFDFLARDLEVGEKADDAVDYEDFDDDDLPDEEDLPAETAPAVAELPPSGGGDDFMGDIESFLGVGEEVQQQPQAMEQEAGDDLDDLFGDVPSSPIDEKMEDANGLPPKTIDEELRPSTPEITPAPTKKSSPPQPEAPAGDDAEPAPTDMDPATLRQYLLQQKLFAMSSYGPDNPPAPPENHEELLSSLWPGFDRNAIPAFLQLLPPKKAHFIGKTPLKPPKPIVPSKIHLEIAQDQERAFRSSGRAPKRALEADSSNLVIIPPPVQEDEDPVIDMDGDIDMDEKLPGGVTMQDLQIICTDWDIKTPVPEEDIPQPEVVQEPSDDEDDWLYEESNRPSKKRKLAKGPEDILALSHVDLPSFDEPLQATAMLAQKITIDMNDPHLLLDELKPETVVEKPKSLGAINRDEKDGNFTKRLIQRYNISNDEAYDMLKENHQNKVRSTLGNVALEHSMPAVRLQWPYYKTKLAKGEARSFHRPMLSFPPNVPITFKKPLKMKRREQKMKDVKTLYDSSKALSMGDNSSVLLLEYSEQHPTILSNFGMGSRFINYYRRKNMEDSARPKADLGETAVLLPQDKSPFSIFGHIDPGETTSAISTGMFRAPIFHQDSKPTDFLVIRNSTGVHGSSFYMRNIENLYVAGQEFPSVDVPGPHSRKVTTASKNRLKMICYRRLRKNARHRISVAEVTEHFPDSSDMQNRQKMKEFMQFSKDYKEWEMRPGEPIPDEDVLKSYVKPEDVCLLESMQVGLQHLHDAGYDRDEDEAADDDETKESDSLEQQLAPWKTSRSFLLATQGKAMLQLHGGGDPTGRGEAFSFIKTSMKGGFKAIGESIEDKIDAQRLKELGGHSYNVARQQKSYEDSIRRIWEAQKSSLSSTIEHSDEESDVDQGGVEDLFGKETPRSEAPTPSFGHDETASQFSRMSTASQAGKVMKINRRIRNSRGQIEHVQEIVKDPRVIKQYQKHRFDIEAATLKLNEIKPTGNAEHDARQIRRIQEELQRLNRNKERRHAREKQKGISTDVTAMSPGRSNSPATPTAAGGPKTGGTQRKCANCGQTLPTTKRNNEDRRSNQRFRFRYGGSSRIMIAICCDCAITFQPYQARGKAKPLFELTPRPPILDSTIRYSRGNTPSSF